MTRSTGFNDMANGAESHARCLHLAALLSVHSETLPPLEAVPGYESAQKYIDNNPLPDYLTTEILWLRNIIGY